ncbi:MAG TPA: TIR domain-containing protein [Alphaproteobacteria bacterium]|nr:TIR domain-containing protein [Alphaproteobacteria bacterium]
MADIFVSYARADKARVAPLVAALERQGWSVWWDPAIAPGQEFDDRIAEEIDKASAVVVVWTPTSVASRWVRGEAREAADRSVLVPVRFENARLPIDARVMHTTDLDSWNEDAKGPVFQELLGALSLLLKKAPRAQEAERRTSICVLPFANMSDDREQEYFSDGISEDIITDLSKVSALSVIARNTAFTFKGRHVDVPQVARQLKVSHVLEGSVRKAGNRVRITAQLIDGVNGDHLWAERYDRDLADIFALQDEISKAIVAALRLKLLPEEKKAIEDRGTTNLQAYDLLLRARTHNGQLSRESLTRAIDLAREAIALDPKFAEAHGLLYGALLNYAIVVPEHSTESWKEAYKTLDRLIALVPDAQAAVLRAQKLIRDGDYLGADQLVSRAEQDFPASSLPVRGYAGRMGLDLAVGRFETHLDGVRAAARRDPLDRIVSWLLRELLDITGRLDEAEAESERSRDLPGDRGFIELLAFLRMKGRATPDQLKAQYARFLASRGAEMRVPIFDQLAPVVLDPQAARSLIQQAINDPAYGDLTRTIWLGLLAGFFDATDEALHAMRRAFVDMGGARLTSVDRYLWMPVLSKARKDARFKDIVRDLGLYDYWKKSGKWGDFARPNGNDDFEIIR